MRTCYLMVCKARFMSCEMMLHDRANSFDCVSAQV